MNSSLEPAVVEAFALAPSDLVTYHTLELTHPNVPEPKRIVQGFFQKELHVDGEAEVFEPVPFDFVLPSTDEGGLQELGVTIDDTNFSVSEFLELALGTPFPVTMYYRPYLSTDLTTPQMDPPLRLFLQDVVVQGVTVTGRAVPVNFLNIAFPSELYSRSRFPGLGNVI